jgi:cytochrome P450
MSMRPNLLSPTVQANPYPLYAELRRHHPVCQVDPGGMWAISRYDDVLYVMKNPQLFSSSIIGGMNELASTKDDPSPESMIGMDPPRHTQMRGLVNRAFTPRALARMEPLIRANAERLAAELGTRARVDFMADFAVPMAASVIGEVMGLDASIHKELKRWSDDFMSSNMGAVSPERLAQIQDSFRQQRGYLEAAINARRRQPTQDMVSELLEAEVEGRKLTQAELLSFLSLLLTAGLETTTHLLGHTIVALAERPELHQRVRQSPELIPALIEEMLRYEPPAQNTLRVSTAEVEVGGVRLPAGAPLIVMLGSANHDEKYFPDPERLDLERPGSNKNIPFGHGIHFCIGAALARLQARLALEALLSRYQAFVRLPEPITYTPSLIVRGPVSLPLQLVPA